ncbi:MAG: hypothetical protein KAI84_12040, partial [Gammaproteobacteria bacterium]|nr:hypothetical protein [Gammaproteobacteria bacterium]
RYLSRKLSAASNKEKHSNRISADRLRQLDGGLYFAELKASVYEYISKNCFVAKVGNKHFFDSKKDAIATIYKKLDTEACKFCSARVFSECN